MNYIKKFENFINENTIVASPSTAPTKPDVDTPTKPAKPQRREKANPITRPSVSPEPKAKKAKYTAEDVAKRFINELNEKGESIKKYLK